MGVSPVRMNEPGTRGGAAARARPRLAYLDHVKLFLTALVILHHVAITYGASGSWFYLEPTAFPLARVAGTIFTATNQFFFMGLFFFLSGYFTPAALARKGRARFLEDRLVRLGIPLVVFTLLVSPYLEHVSSLRDETPSAGYVDQLFDFFREGDFPPGPLWFVAALLAFSIVVALVGRPNRAPGDATHGPGAVTHGRLLAFACVLAASEFAVRTVFPAGREWRHFQLAFFPQYVLLFALGTMAERHRWLDALDAKLLRVWVPVMAAIVVTVTAIVFSILPKGPKGIAPWLGGLHIEALALSAIESLYCVGASVTLLVVFRDRIGDGPAWLRALAPDAYAVYVLHAPIIVAMAITLHPLAIDGVFKFVIVGATSIAACFALSHFVLRKSALVRRVL